MTKWGEMHTGFLLGGGGSPPQEEKENWMYIAIINDNTMSYFPPKTNVLHFRTLLHLKTTKFMVVRDIGKCPNYESLKQVI